MFRSPDLMMPWVATMHDGWAFLVGLWAVYAVKGNAASVGAVGRPDRVQRPPLERIPDHGLSLGSALVNSATDYLGATLVGTLEQHRQTFAVG